MMSGGRADMQPSETETCPEMVYRGGTWDPIRESCGKPIKRRGVCGIHARSLDSQDRRDAEARAKRDGADLGGDLARRFQAATGVLPSVQWNDGRLILSHADAELILAALSEVGRG